MRFNFWCSSDVFCVCVYVCVLFVYYCLAAGENELEAKYRRSVLDIAVLQDRIGECDAGYV